MSIIKAKFNPFSLLAIPAVFIVIEVFSRYQFISGIILAGICILLLLLILVVDINERIKKRNKVKKGDSYKDE